MNLELFEKIKKDIMEEPRRLYMEDFRRTWEPEEVKEDDSLPPCGTAACIAGKACMISGEPWFDADGTAAELLGIPDSRRVGVSELSRGLVPLFYVERWPENLRNSYCDIKTPKHRAKVACEAIDAFIRGEF